MKNYQITIKNNNNVISEFTLEEENKSFARWIAIGRFKRENPDKHHWVEGKEYVLEVKETTRKLIKVQEPRLWQDI